MGVSVPNICSKRSPSDWSWLGNIVDRDELQAAYINRVLDDMDIKDMMAILYDYMDVEFDKYTVDELIETVEEYYPDLIDDSDNDQIPDESTGWN